MATYFENFFVGDPMIELTAEQAREASSYVLEPDPGRTPRRLEQWLFGELARVIYPATTPSAAIAELQRTRDLVATWVTSAVVRDGDVTAWTVWEYAPGGALAKRVEYRQSPTFDSTRWFDAAGGLGGTEERRYNEAGECVETVSVHPDGTRIVVDD